MCQFQHRRIWAVCLLVFSLVLGCGSDEAEANGDGLEFDSGEASFTASQDVEGEFETDAYFTQVCMDRDEFCLLLNNDEISIRFTKELQQPGRPTPGTYTIDGAGGDGVYTHLVINPGGEDEETFFAGSDAGTLEITNAGDDFAEGIFEFSATELGTGQWVVVSEGEFRARLVGNH